MFVIEDIKGDTTSVPKNKSKIYTYKGIIDIK